jgi:hypothetical protein
LADIGLDRAATTPAADMPAAATAAADDQVVNEEAHTEREAAGRRVARGNRVRAAGAVKRHRRLRPPTAGPHEDDRRHHSSQGFYRAETGPGFHGFGWRVADQALLETDELCRRRWRLGIEFAGVGLFVHGLWSGEFWNEKARNKVDGLLRNQARLDPDNYP